MALYSKTYKINLLSPGRHPIKSGSNQDVANAVLLEIKNGLHRLQVRMSDGVGAKVSRRLENFTKNWERRIHKRIRVAGGIPPTLSSFTMKERRFQNDPNLLQIEIEKFWYAREAGAQKGKKSPSPIPQIAPTKRVPFTPPASNLGPPLLRTGRLDRSLYVNLNLGQKGGKGSSGYSQKGTEYQYFRTIVYGTKLPYAKAIINGEQGEAYSLVKITKTTSKNIFIPIPKEFLEEIKSHSDSLAAAGYSIEVRYPRLPERNPFYFDKEDIEELENILPLVGEDAQKAFSRNVKSSADDFDIEFIDDPF